METRGLLELVLEVADLDRSASFYRELLGMAQVTQWEDDRPGVWVRLGPNEVLGLWPAWSGGAGVGIHGARGGAHVHFAIYVEPGTLEQWRDQLAGSGLFVEGPVQFDSGRSLFLTDPDGNVVELADWERDWEGRPVAKAHGSG
jgi:catechol 2,3-dioxygenase-like lactoylglutathione lyase family enzyme